MSLFVGSFIVFGVVMAAMAIGVIVSNRSIAGSCGGLANMMDNAGEPMCECGARAGESCGVDADRRFDLDKVAIDEAVPAHAREPAAV